MKKTKMKAPECARCGKEHWGRCPEFVDRVRPLSSDVVKVSDQGPRKEGEVE